MLGGTWTPSPTSTPSATTTRPSVSIATPPFGIVGACSREHGRGPADLALTLESRDPEPLAARVRPRGLRAGGGLARRRGAARHRPPARPAEQGETRQGGPGPEGRGQGRPDGPLPADRPGEAAQGRRLEVYARRPPPAPGVHHRLRLARTPDFRGRGGPAFSTPTSGRPATTRPRCTRRARIRTSTPAATACPAGPKPIEACASTLQSLVVPT